MGLGRIVYDTLDGLSVTADATQDLWSLTAAANQRVRLLGWEITSEDTAAEIVQLELRHITAAGSGGTASTTEQLSDKRQDALTGTVRTLDTTPGAEGGLLMKYAWEQVGPVGHIWTPEMAPVSAVAQGFALGWNSAVAATIHGWLCWEEILG